MALSKLRVLKAFDVNIDAVCFCLINRLAAAVWHIGTKVKLFSMHTSSAFLRVSVFTPFFLLFSMQNDQSTLAVVAQTFPLVLIFILLVVVYQSNFLLCSMNQEGKFILLHNLCHEHELVIWTFLYEKLTLLSVRVIKERTGGLHSFQQVAVRCT